MADNKIKVRCSVCGDGIPVENGCVSEHNHKALAAQKVVCHGSFLPVFQDSKGNYQVGTVMYVSRRRAPWEMDE